MMSPRIAVQLFATGVAETWAREWLRSVPEVTVVEAEARAALVVLAGDWREEARAVPPPDTPGRPGVVMVVAGDWQEIVAAHEAGILGVVHARDSTQELLEAIRRAAEGKPYYSASIHGLLATALRPPAKSAADSECAARLARLTPRERQVIDGVLACASDRQIAAKLHVGIATVRTHLDRACKHLGVQGRAGIFRFFGLAGPEPAAIDGD